MKFFIEQFLSLYTFSPMWNTRLTDGYILIVKLDMEGYHEQDLSHIMRNFGKKDLEQQI